MDQIIALKSKQDKWTPEEEVILREMVGKYLAREIGAKVGRTKYAVLKKIGRMKLCGLVKGSHPKWTEYQLEQMKLHHSKMTVRQFSTIHGLTKDQVYNRCKALGLRFLADIKWTPEKVAILRECTSSKEAAKRIGKDTSSVLRRAKKLGIVLCESREKKVEAVEYQKPVTVKIQSPKKQKLKIVKRTKRQEISRIEWCPACHAPVCDWSAHYSRMPECRARRVA